MISGQVGIILYYIKNRRLWSTVEVIYFNRLEWLKIRLKTGQILSFRQKSAYNTAISRFFIYN